MNFLLAGIGASIGAMLRYAITNYGKKHWEWIGNKFSNLPTPTLFINLTGVMGGYTTFSTMNTELVELYKSKNYRGLVFYAVSSYLGGLVLVYCGYYLGNLLK